MSDAEAVVREFCEAVVAKRPSELRRFFTDDVVYHNMPLDPALGIDATMGVLEMFIGLCEAVRFDIHHLAVDGDTVLTERTDVFTMGGEERPLAVMGSFTVRDGRISLWRDYFDMAKASAVLGLG